MGWAITDWRLEALLSGGLDAWLDARELLTPLSARLLPPHELLPSLPRRPRPPGPSLLSERADGAAGDTAQLHTALIVKHESLHIKHVIVTILLTPLDYVTCTDYCIKAS